MDRRLSEPGNVAGVAANKVEFELGLEPHAEPPPYRDVVPRRAWLPPGAAASSVAPSPIITSMASTVSAAPVSPHSPHSPLSPMPSLSPLTPLATTHTHAPTSPIAPPAAPSFTPSDFTPPPVPPPATPKRASFASLSLIGDNGLRVVGLPPILLETIASTLSKGWKGVRNSQASGDAFEWTLEGAPWASSAHSFAAHRLLEYLLFSLSKAGWQLVVAPTLPGRRRDTFILRSSAPRERVFFTVMFDRFTVLILDAPPDAREALREVMDTFPSAPPTEPQPRLLRVVMTSRTDDPWLDRSDLAAELMCALLAGFEGAGYEVAAAYDFLARPQEKNGKVAAGTMPSADAWVFGSR